MWVVDFVSVLVRIVVRVCVAEREIDNVAVADNVVVVDCVRAGDVDSEAVTVLEELPLTEGDDVVLAVFVAERVDVRVRGWVRVCDRVEVALRGKGGPVVTNSQQRGRGTNREHNAHDIGWQHATYCVVSLLMGLKNSNMLPAAAYAMCTHVAELEAVVVSLGDALGDNEGEPDEVTDGVVDDGVSVALIDAVFVVGADGVADIDVDAVAFCDFENVPVAVWDCVLEPLFDEVGVRLPDADAVPVRDVEHVAV